MEHAYIRIHIHPSIHMYIHTYARSTIPRSYYCTTVVNNEINKDSKHDTVTSDSQRNQSIKRSNCGQMKCRKENNKLSLYFGLCQRMCVQLYRQHGICASKYSAKIVINGDKRHCNGFQLYFCTDTSYLYQRYVNFVQLPAAYSITKSSMYIHLKKNKIHKMDCP